MPAGWDMIGSTRINRIIQALVDVREKPQELVWVRRARLVPAVDGELMGRFIGQVLIADLIADDAKAVTYQSGRFQFERTTAPNIKLGVHMTQEMLNQLAALNAGGGIPGGGDIFDDYLNRTMEAILLGIWQRMEALTVAMLIDGLSYDRLGIKMSNVTWGMPASFKVTAAVPWDTYATATPIADIFAINRNAVVRYGQVFNRLTMSRQAFDHMIRTTEFRDRVKLILNPAMAVTALPYENTEFMLNMASNLLGMTIELNDWRYWQQNEAGSILSYPYQPINTVIFTNTQDDGRGDAYDFSNGIVTESIVSSLTNTGAVGAFAAPAYGPVGYSTAPHDLNPPNITFWGVSRGFPRKHRLTSSAVLTVGTFTDTIPPAALEF